MFKGLLVSALLVLTTISAGAQSYPTGPNSSLTPGELCQRPSAHRYPENIAYCERDVSSRTKAAIFKEYDNKLGFRTLSMKRQAFKIDHYIPLCAGGSNSTDNLWPQHVSIYTITDPLEQKVCEKMAEGVLLQKDAIEMIRHGKNNLEDVPLLMSQLENM